MIQDIPVVDINPQSVLTALTISDRYNYAYWDSLILATALLNDCSIVYSEDMQHNQFINQAVRIINPFQ
ncbi:MAG: PIN domain-containing protein [Leptolyngbya sp. UWPOB_LEPTO1]|nr:PIN domain-containing protein [Leptolyngbya sp. UWPOB_LEPTO1]